MKGKTQEGKSFFDYPAVLWRMGARMLIAAFDMACILMTLVRMFEHTGSALWAALLLALCLVLGAAGRRWGALGACTNVRRIALLARLFYAGALMLLGNTSVLWTTAGGLVFIGQADAEAARREERTLLPKRLHLQRLHAEDGMRALVGLIAPLLSYGYLTYFAIRAGAVIYALAVLAADWAQVHFPVPGKCPAVRISSVSPQAMRAVGSTGFFACLLAMAAGVFVPMVLQRASHGACVLLLFLFALGSALAGLTLGLLPTGKAVSRAYLRNILPAILFGVMGLGFARTLGWMSVLILLGGFFFTRAQAVSRQALREEGEPLGIALRSKKGADRPLPQDAGPIDAAENPAAAEEAALRARDAALFLPRLAGLVLGGMLVQWALKPLARLAPFQALVGPGGVETALLYLLIGAAAAGYVCVRVCCKKL